MKGTLTEHVREGRPDVRRARLHPDRVYTAPDGGTLTLPGRSLMLVRNVGHHMYTDAVRDADGAEIPEGILDAAVTSLIALHDLQRQRAAAQHAAPARSTSSSRRCTARTRWPSPTTLFGRVEDAARPAAQHAEDRHHGRGAAHLRQPEGLHRARRSDRVVFINTGFLDRTGDEIHTSMEAGPMVRKDDMRDTAWIAAYEDQQRRYRPALRPARQGADRQGHVGHARPDGRRCWRRRSPTRRPAPTPPGCPRPPPRRCTRCTTTRSTSPRGRTELAGRARAAARRPADHSAGRPAELVARGRPAGARQQLPGHPGLRGALDRPGRRLLQGAGHPRRRPDGGPRHAAHLQPAHRQLAAPRHRDARRR